MQANRESTVRPCGHSGLLSASYRSGTAILSAGSIPFMHKRHSAMSCAHGNEQVESTDGFHKSMLGETYCIILLLSLLGVALPAISLGQSPFLLKTFGPGSDTTVRGAFSSDSSFIITAGGGMHKWSSENGAQLVLFDVAFTEETTAIGISRSGETAVIGYTSGDLAGFNTTTGRKTFGFRAHSSPVISISFSENDDKMVTSCYDNVAKVWDFESKSLLGSLVGHQGRVEDVSFSNNGALIVTASQDKTVMIWEAESFQVVHTLSGHSSWVLSARFSRDDVYVISGARDGVAKLWEVETARLVRSYAGLDNQEPSVDISPDNRYIAMNDGSSVMLVNASNGNLIRRLNDQYANVRRVAFSPDGRFLLSTGSSGMPESSVRIWDVKTGMFLHALTGHIDSVTAVSFAADKNRIATASLDGTVRLWDIQTGAYRKILGVTGQSPYWGLRSSGLIHCAMYSSDGAFILSGGEGNFYGGRDSVRIWRSDNYSLISNLSSPGGGVRALAQDFQGERFAIGTDDGNVRVYRMETGAFLLDLPLMAHHIDSVAFSHSGQELAVTGRATRQARLVFFAQVWDLQAIQMKMEATRNSPYDRIVFAKDDSSIIAAGPAIEILHNDTGETLERFAVNNNCTALDLSSDGRFLVAGSYYGQVYIYDLSNFALLRTFEGHVSKVNSVAFSPDQKYALSGSLDRSAKLWKLDDILPPWPPTSDSLLFY
jgi:WD40 repeat protein